MRRLAGSLVLIGMVGLAPAMPHAQGRGGGRGEAPLTPKAAAPFDLTGYWTAVVTRDWRFRMVVPPKGDYAGVPLNAVARKVADAWDPAETKPRESSAAATAQRTSCATRPLAHHLEGRSDADGRHRRGLADARVLFRAEANCGR